MKEIGGAGAVCEGWHSKDDSGARCRGRVSALKSSQMFLSMCGEVVDATQALWAVKL